MRVIRSVLVLGVGDQPEGDKVCVGDLLGEAPLAVGAGEAGQPVAEAVRSREDPPPVHQRPAALTGFLLLLAVR